MPIGGRKTGTWSPERILLAAMALHTPIFAAICLAIEKPLVAAVGVSFGVTIVAAAAWRIAPSSARIPIALGMIAQPAILTGLLTGHPWQVDTHMYFFAVMALLSLMADIRALIAAAAFVAVHHLGFNFLFSGLIYPGGGDLARTVMHAVILVIETAGLSLMVYDRNAQQGASSIAAAKAAEAVEMTERARAEVEATQEEAARQRTEMTAALRSSIGDVVAAASEGRFEKRVNRRFDDDALNALSEDVNTLLEGVDKAVGATALVLSAYAAGDVTGNLGRNQKGVFEKLAKAVEALQEQLLERDRLAAEREATEAANLRRTEQAAQLSEAMRTVVDGALEGDFTARIPEDWADEDQRATAERMNELLAGVEAGLSDLSSMMRRLSLGDVAARMEGEHKGAFAELKTVADATAAELQTIAAEIRSGADAIGAGVAEIRESSSSISSRAASQAAAITETNTTIESFAETIRTNSDNAAAANDISTNTASIAAEGGDVAREAVAAIRRVSEGAEKISEITGMVEGIAFQTNLLALNAGIEAARAGEAGKGFAVVAQEIGVLAQRATDASRQITELIEASAIEVAHGVKLVEATGGSLREIGEGVAKVVEAMSDISHAGQKQANGVDELTSTFGGLDQQTSTNAKLASESARAAAELDTQAARLASAIAFFKKSESDVAKTAAA